MDALAGFRYREIIQRLKQLGREFHRQAAGSHEIWFNPALNATRPFLTTPATCPKALYVPSSSRPALTLAPSCRSRDRHSVAQENRGH